METTLETKTENKKVCSIIYEYRKTNYKTQMVSFERGQQYPLKKLFSALLPKGSIIKFIRIIPCNE